MFDIGWSEMAVVAVIALLVIGPKELPRTMRTVAHWFGKARGLAREFQSGLDEIVRETDLEDARQALKSTRDFNPSKIIGDTIDPTGGIRGEVKDVEKAAAADVKSADVSEPASGGQDDGPKATIVKQPANVAPAHSVTPPAETSATPVEADGKDSSKQSA